MMRFLFLLLVAWVCSNHAWGASNSDVFNLKVGEWKELPNTAIKDVFPSRDNHPAWGVIGPRAVTDAWGGGALDTKRNLLIVTGGGHGDYGGNEVYEFNLETLKWSRATEPSKVGINGTKRALVLGSPAPVSSHTYDGLLYLPTIDRVWKFGGGAFPSEASEPTVFLYDTAKRTWSIGSEAPRAVGHPCTDYDAKKNKVYVAHETGLMQYDVASGSWEVLSKGSPHAMHYGGVFDSETRTFVVLQASNGALNFFKPDESGVRQKSSVTNGEWGGVAGMIYHAPSKRIVLWSGGREVWTVRTDTWQVRKFSNPKGEAPSANRPGGGRKTPGIFSRWQYVPKYDVFLGLNGSGDNVWIYKLPPESFTEKAGTDS